MVGTAEQFSYRRAQTMNLAVCRWSNNGVALNTEEIGKPYDLEMGTVEDDGNWSKEYNNEKEEHRSLFPAMNCRWKATFTLGSSVESKGGASVAQSAAVKLIVTRKNLPSQKIFKFASTFSLFFLYSDEQTSAMRKAVCYVAEGDFLQYYGRRNELMRAI